MMSVLRATKRKFRSLLWKIYPSLFHRLSKTNGAVFSIGIYAGDDPIALQPWHKVTNPILTRDHVTDRPADYVADPFMCQVDGRWHMFFEVMCLLDEKGVIASAISDDGETWIYNGTVLSEPFHLAYPYVFNWQEKTYMIPDSGPHGVRLYEAVDFPNRWKYLKTLLNGQRYVDSTLFEYKQKWWMFTATSPIPDIRKTLRLYSANNPFGPWSEHPCSPIRTDCNRVARPGGRMAHVGDRLFRFAQDGFPRYGSRVRAFEILELTDTSYQEKEVDSGPALAGGDFNWNSAGMHHVDAHFVYDKHWLACVDGWFDRPS
jgi:hypothetical protein